MSIYFSADRKIEKVKQRTFILLKCSFLMLAHLQYMLIWYKVSLNRTYCHIIFTKITLKLRSLLTDWHINKNKALCDTYSKKQSYLQSKMEMSPVEPQLRYRPWFACVWASEALKQLKRNVKKNPPHLKNEVQSLVKQLE